MVEEDEYVARAIYERRLWRLGLVKDGKAFLRQPPWEELEPRYRETWLAIARTAIEAIQSFGLR